MIWFPRRLRGTCDPEDIVAEGRGAGAGSRRKSLLFNTPCPPPLSQGKAEERKWAWTETQVSHVFGREWGGVGDAVRARGMPGVVVYCWQ